MGSVAQCSGYRLAVTPLSTPTHRSVRARVSDTGSQSTSASLSQLVTADVNLSNASTLRAAAAAAAAPGPSLCCCSKITRVRLFLETLLVPLAPLGVCVCVWSCHYCKATELALYQRLAAVLRPLFMPMPGFGTCS